MVQAIDLSWVGAANAAADANESLIGSEATDETTFEVASAAAWMAYQDAEAQAAATQAVAIAQAIANAADAKAAGGTGDPGPAIAAANAAFTTAGQAASQTYDSAEGAADSTQAIADANATLADAKTNANLLLGVQQQVASSTDSYLDAESTDYDVEEKADAQALDVQEVSDATSLASAVQSFDQQNPSPWADQAAAQDNAAEAKVVGNANATPPVVGTAAAEMNQADAADDAEMNKEIAQNDAAEALADSQAQAAHDQTVAAAQAAHDLTVAQANAEAAQAAAGTYVTALPAALAAPTPAAPLTLTGDYGHIHDIGGYAMGDTSDTIDGVIGQMFSVGPDNEPSNGTFGSPGGAWFGSWMTAGLGTGGGSMPFGILPQTSGPPPQILLPGGMPAGGGGTGGGAGSVIPGGTWVGAGQSGGSGYYTGPDRSIFGPEPSPFAPQGPAGGGGTGGGGGLPGSGATGGTGTGGTGAPPSGGNGGAAGTTGGLFNVQDDTDNPEPKETGDKLEAEKAARTGHTYVIAFSGNAAFGDSYSGANVLENIFEGVNFKIPNKGDEEQYPWNANLDADGVQKSPADDDVHEGLRFQIGDSNLATGNTVRVVLVGYSYGGKAAVDEVARIHDLINEAGLVPEIHLILIDAIDPASTPPNGINPLTNMPYALGNKALKVREETLGNLESLKNIYQKSTKVLNAAFKFPLHGVDLKFKGPGKDKVENKSILVRTLTDFAKGTDVEGEHPHVQIIHKLKEDLIEMITDLEEKEYGTAPEEDENNPGE